MTKQPAKTLSDRILEADIMAGRYLGNFNELDERGLGHTKKAQALFDKAQRWLDRYNALTGNS